MWKPKYDLKAQHSLFYLQCNDLTGRKEPFLKGLSWALQACEAPKMEEHPCSSLFLSVTSTKGIFIPCIFKYTFKSEYTAGLWEMVGAQLDRPVPRAVNQSVC